MADSEHFIINGLSPVQASKLLCEELNKKSLERDELAFVLESLKCKIDSDENVEWIRSLHRSTFRGRIPGTGIYINVRRAALTSVALILDALATRGLSIGLLTMSGHASKSIAYISPKHGAFCNFLTLEVGFREGAETMTASDVVSQTASLCCPHPKLNCEYYLNEKCAVTLQAVRENIHKLERDNVLTMNVDGCVTKASG